MLKATDSAFPVYDKYFSVEEPGLTVAAYFALHAPAEIPDWFRQEESAEERFFQWRCFYAEKMIEHLNREK